MASTSDDSDEAVWQRELKAPIDPKVRLDPDTWRTKKHRINKDPRKFEFDLYACIAAYTEILWEV